MLRSIRSLMILPPHHNVGQFVLSLRIAEINTLHIIGSFSLKQSGVSVEPPARSGMETTGGARKLARDLAHGKTKRPSGFQK